MFAEEDGMRGGWRVTVRNLDALKPVEEHFEHARRLQAELRERLGRRSRPSDVTSSSPALFAFTTHVASIPTNSSRDRSRTCPLDLRVAVSRMSKSRGCEGRRERCGCADVPKDFQQQEEEEGGYSIINGPDNTASANEGRMASNALPSNSAGSSAYESGLSEITAIHQDGMLSYVNSVEDPG
ncbi:hypothetical protein NLJ89_g6357 [Agrocybe chaxingu]|uniref:Uncharacterized protein n=1 Tax=Agrocybe chaxingu TaxID=84603 RepID=A0A9W8K5Q0_9AGAR|nr:hypothetical protein NLJ89_g6357 [Agrocybe chaxingu]